MDGKIRCCFAGHSKIDNGGIEIEKEVENIAVKLIDKYGVSEFWVGNYGEFDRRAASVIRSLKKRYPHIELVLIIPYLTGEFIGYKREYNEKYDSVLMADTPQNTPKKFHIIKANEYMVDNSDFLICHVCRDWGGAAQTLSYAKKRAKNGGIKIYRLKAV